MSFVVVAVRYFTHGETQEELARFDTEDEAQADENRRTRAILENGYTHAESEVATPVYLVRADGETADRPARKRK